MLGFGILAYLRNCLQKLAHKGTATQGLYILQVVSLE